MLCHNVFIKLITLFLLFKTFCKYRKLKKNPSKNKLTRINESSSFSAQAVPAFLCCPKCLLEYVEPMALNVFKDLTFL